MDANDNDLQRVRLHLAYFPDDDFEDIAEELDISVLDAHELLWRIREECSKLYSAETCGLNGPV